MHTESWLTWVSMRSGAQWYMGVDNPKSNLVCGVGACSLF